MKCKKGSRKLHRSIAGPSVILKSVKAEDSFSAFGNVRLHSTDAQWKTRLAEFRTEALFREDPFGAEEYLVPYSMDKKRRWIVPDLFDDEIENVQDAERSLRVSASVHSCSRNGPRPLLQRPPWGWERGLSHVEAMPTEQFHDVSREGIARHLHYEQADINTLERFPRGKRQRMTPERETASNLPFEKDQLFQKAHVRYNIMRMQSDRRKVAVENLCRFRCRWMYDTTRGRDPKRAWIDYEKRALNDEEIFLEQDYEEDDDLAALIPSPTLADCVIPRQSPAKRTKKRGASRGKFVDEVMTRVAFPSIEEEEEEGVEGFEMIERSTMKLNEGLIGDGIEGSCSICIEPFGERALPFSLSCGHAFCSNCWLQQVSCALEEGRDEAGCMFSSCCSVLSLDAARSLLSASSFSLYREHVQNRRIATGKARRCPQCQWVVEYGGGSSDQCSCGALLCPSCPSLLHSPLGCDQMHTYREYLKQNGVDLHLSSSSPVVSELVRCPACATPMQRSIGCDHMTCICGADFCYRCGRERDMKHMLRKGECTAKELESVLLFDVFTSSAFFTRKRLLAAVRVRTELSERKGEIMARLRVLSPSAARKYARKIVAISLLIEAHLLRSSHKSDYVAVARHIERTLFRFLNSKSEVGSEKRALLTGKVERMIENCYELAAIR